MRTVEYAYDTTKRLTREQVTDAGLGNRTSTWSYDLVGNRLSQVRTTDAVSETTAYVYDVNDRLLSETRSGGQTPGITTHQYDAAGNLLQSAGPNGLTDYSYDASRRMTGALTPEGSVSYTYDAIGIRQSQTVNGVTTRYLVDPNHPYARSLRNAARKATPRPSTPSATTALRNS